MGESSSNNQSPKNDNNVNTSIISKSKFKSPTAKNKLDNRKPFTTVFSS